MKKPKKLNRLDILKQTKDRTPMPRPTVFRDKTKYDRKRQKKEWTDDSSPSILFLRVNAVHESPAMAHFLYSLVR